MLVALVALLAAKPLLKLAVVVLLATFIFIGAISSGLGMASGVVFVLITLLFLFGPRRRSFPPR